MTPGNRSFIIIARPAAVIIPCSAPTNTVRDGSSRADPPLTQFESETAHGITCTCNWTEVHESYSHKYYVWKEWESCLFVTHLSRCYTVIPVASIIARWREKRSDTTFVLECYVCVPTRRRTTAITPRPFHTANKSISNLTDLFTI